MELGRGNESRHAPDRGTVPKNALSQATLARHVMALDRGTVPRHGTRPRHRV